MNEQRFGALCEALRTGGSLWTGLGPPGWDGSATPQSIIASLLFDPAATQAQKINAVALVNGWSWMERTKRTLYAIRTDLLALSAAQKTNVWAALIAGVPPLWSQDAGPNAAALATMQMFGASATLSAADVLEAKIRAAAFYVQDNDSFLVHPVWDSTINISGSQ